MAKVKYIACDIYKRGINVFKVLHKSLLSGVRTPLIKIRMIKSSVIV